MMAVSSGGNVWRAANPPLWAPALLFIAVAAIDIATTWELATGIGFILIVLLGLRYGDPRAVLIIGGVGAILAVFGAFAQPASAAPRWMQAEICGLMVGGICAAAAHVHFRSQADLSLRRSQEKNLYLAEVVDASAVAIIRKTVNGDVVSWNASAERLFGYAAAEIIGRPIGLLILDHVAEAHHRERLQRGDVVRPFDTLMQHKDGRRLNVSITLASIRDAAGTVVGTSMIAQDIDARLREEETFRRTAEAMPSGIVMIDVGGGVTLVNMRTEKLFGYRREELLGRNVATLVPQRFRDDLDRYMRSIFANPMLHATGAGNEICGLSKNGNEFPIEIGLHPLQTGDGLLLLGVIVDLSERVRTVESLRRFNEKLESQVVRRTADLTRANRELEEFAYAASHDLKAPLRVIDNASKWLEEDLQPHLTTETRETMNLLRGRIRRMEKLLDDLLDYSRVGSNNGHQHAEIVQGGELIDDILKLLSPPPGFEVGVSANFSDILVERTPLRQVLMNLISNAIKHHDKKVGSIEINVDITETNYFFSVKDDGPGIDLQFHEQIFKMFRTLKPKDQREGSGMGLALVRKTVELGGGKIELVSAPGRGSVFAFTWPKFVARTEEAA